MIDYYNILIMFDNIIKEYNNKKKILEADKIK